MAEEKKYESKWTDDQKTDFAQNLGKAGSSIAKINLLSHRIFWVLIALTTIGAAIAGFYLYDYFSTSREISLLLSSKDNVLLGVPFELTADFNNGSGNVLKGATLSLFLPEGAAVLGMEKDKRIFIKELGDIDSGKSLTEKIPLLIFNGPGAVKNFNVSISYSSSLGISFEKKQNVEILGGEPAIKLDIVAPEKVLNNEEFEMAINYSNISEYNFSNVKLNLDFPKNFILINSVPEISGNILNIGDLAKNKQGETLIVGKVVGAEQSFFEINSNIESSYKGQVFKISEKTAKINIAPSPLFVKIESDVSGGYVFPNNNIRFKIAYFNNSDVGLSDAVVKAKLSGEMFDFSKLRTNGSFNSRDNTLTWNAASNPALRLIEPGGGGGVEFEIETKSGYPIKRLSDKNFILKVAAEISSPTVPYYVAADKTISLANWEAKIAGNVIIDSKAYFRDFSSLASGIPQKGSLPPKVNQPINFIIHWTIRNFATDIKDVNVGAYLGPGVRFIGELKSNVTSAPVYNERTQAVSWQIDKIAAAKGIVNNPVEAVFQIELLPNITQVGNYPEIIGDVSISAIDEFVNLRLSGVADSLTTGDLSDIGFDLRSGAVVQ